MIEWLVKKKIFKNANHAIWFLCSAAIFLLVLINRFYPRATWVPLAALLAVHVPPFAKSSLVVLRKQKNDIYDRDCVWFNFLMIVLYVVLWAVIFK
jgi:hypothetical protein